MSAWLQVLVLIATPLLAFIGALVGHWVQRRSAAEMHQWRHREETMRMLRWAADKALDDEPHVSAAGVQTLNALLEAQLLQPEDEDFVEKIAQRIAADAPVEYPETVEFYLVDEEEGDSDG